MAVTIKKIAELAGVSVGTVDRALNNRKGVNQEVAGRIKEIADSVGYVPNTVAKGLVARRKEVKIGVIIHTPKHAFIEELLAGIQAANKKIADYGVEIMARYGEGYDADSQIRMIDELVDEGIHALAIIPLNDKRVVDKLEELRKRGITVALMVSDIDVDCLAYVGCDLYRGGRIIGGLAGMLGGRDSKVVYCTAPLEILGNVRRLDGLKDVLQERYPDIHLLGVCELQNDDLAAYTQAAIAFKEYRDADTIVVTTGCTKGVLSAIEETVFEKKVNVITLDLAKPVEQAMARGLVQATVVQHPFLQGKKAIETLFNYVVMGKVPDSKKIYIDTDIKIYESIF